MTLVREVMTKKVITVPQVSDVRQVCRLLRKSKLTGLPVVDQRKRLVGFVSERDVIAAVPKPGFLKCKAKQIMTRRVKTITADEPVTNASKIFSSEKFRCLPVVKGDKVVGIISRKDVIEVMLGNYY